MYCLQVECRDAEDLAGWNSSSDLTFILMMEVLDNSPHDRIHKDSHTGEWLQTHVLDSSGQVKTFSGLKQIDRSDMSDVHALCSEHLNIFCDACVTSFEGFIVSASTPQAVKYARVMVMLSRAQSCHLCCEEQGSPRVMQEQLQPLTDELIQRCLSMGPWEHNGKPLWHRILDFAMDAGEHRISTIIKSLCIQHAIMSVCTLKSIEPSFLAIILPDLLPSKISCTTPLASHCSGSWYDVA